MVEFEKLIAFTILIIISIITTLFAWSLGFFRFPYQKNTHETSINWSQVVGAFAVMIAVEIIVVPFFYYIWIYFKDGKIPDFSIHKLNITEQGWLNILGILATALALFIYSRLLDKEVLKDVWGRGNNQRGEWILNFLVGAVTWFIVYPIVAALGQLISLILALFYVGPHIDQVAVKHMKSIMDNYWVFLITTIEVVTLVPMIEELIFRGFLQTKLKSKFGTFKAIIITSLIFAFFHFSWSQKLDNIELIASLFVLSCFLGYIRERQQSLWASIGLHSTFNALSLLFLSKIGKFFL